jgi:cobalt-zinc-cadmium efflux system outer membrane protein
MERVTEGSTSFHTYGFNLNVELPILSWNGGGRDVANRTAEIAKLEHQYSQNQERLRQQRLIQVYRSSVESLKKSVNSEALNRKHKQIDNLFKSGLTSGATVIEAHRQITEFTESQHEHELLALDSLMQIKFLLRQNLNEVLK